MFTYLKNSFARKIARRVTKEYPPIIDHLNMNQYGEIDFAKLEGSLGQKGVALVKHPGYFRPVGIEKLMFYVKNLKYFAKDFKTYIRFGGLGTWERNKESKAFVPRILRKILKTLVFLLIYITLWLVLQWLIYFWLGLPIIL